MLSIYHQRLLQDYWHCLCLSAPVYMLWLQNCQLINWQHRLALMQVSISRQKHLHEINSRWRSVSPISLRWGCYKDHLHDRWDGDMSTCGDHAWNCTCFKVQVKWNINSVVIGRLSFLVISAVSKLFIELNLSVPSSQSHIHHFSWVSICSRASLSLERHVKQRTFFNLCLVPYSTSVRLCSQHAWRVV